MQRCDAASAIAACSAATRRTLPDPLIASGTSAAETLTLTPPQCVITRHSLSERTRGIGCIASDQREKSARSRASSRFRRAPIN